MNRDEYLLSCGWKYRGSYAPGIQGWWIDPLPHPMGYAVGRSFTAEEAERIQLDRDAARRDYVNARRPPCPS
jgi:hypothetical protein